MPDLTQLHELTGQVRPPDLQQLSDLAVRRRRRTAAMLVTGVTAATALAVALTVGLVGQRSSDAAPVTPDTPPEPSPTPTVARTFAPLTAEEIRDHPDASSQGGRGPATASPARARVWSVCLDDCRDDEYLLGEQQQAVEVTRDDFEHSAVHALGRDAVSHAVDDWWFIEARGGAALVDSAGHERALSTGDDVDVPEIAGPPVYTSSGLGYVDLRTATLHSLAQDYWDWQGAGDSWFWGTLWLVPNTTVKQQAALWRNPDGSFEVEVLPIGPRDCSAGMLRAGIPGTMAVVECSPARVAHLSTDYGQTWQVRVVPDGVDSGGELPSDWTTWEPAAR